MHDALHSEEDRQIGISAEDLNDNEYIVMSPSGKVTKYKAAEPDLTYMQEDVDGQISRVIDSSDSSQ